MFLALVQVFLVFAAVDWRKKGDKTLLAIIITWPLLTIRGAYGIVSVEVPEYSCAPLPFPFPPVLLFIVTDHKV